MADPPNHFFKFIPPGFIFNLSIPKSFWTNLKEEISMKAILRRGHHKWPVNITDGGGFGDGWRKFVKDNGVKECDLIVFKHLEKTVFDFMVFDQSACERDYPNLLDEVDIEEPLAEFDLTHTHKMSKKIKKRKRNDYSSQNEDKFQPGDNRCFMTVMTPYYIETSRVSVPIAFARSNGLINKKVDTQIVLVDEAERTWQAMLKLEGTQLRLVGWRKLIIENHIEVGDTCMFKLVKPEEMPVINVYNLGKNPIDQVKKETSSMMKKETSSNSNNYPYYISTLKTCTFKSSRLYLPVGFSIPNGLEPGETILRDDKGKSWQVELKKYGERKFYLGFGLREFCDANGLKEGDAYKFELIENEKEKPPIVNFSLNVDSIMNAEEPLTESGSIYTYSKLSSFNKLDVEEPLTDSDSIKTYKSSKKVKNRKRNSYTFQNKDKLQPSDDRCFMTVMTPYYIKSSRVSVPIEFARSNGLTNKKLGAQKVHTQMVLVDEAQRTWPATLELKGTRIRFTGWRKLIIKNCLEVGDTCMFKLVKYEDMPVFNVYNLGRKAVTDNIQIKKETRSAIKKGKKPVMNNVQVKKGSGSKITKKPASSTLSDHRYFISTLNHNCITKFGLYLPVEWSISNGLKLGKMILRYDKGRSWKVQLNNHGGKTFSIGSGFNKFCVGNGLKEGNAYKFEIMKNEKDKPPVVNVSLNEESTSLGEKDSRYFIGEVKSYFIENSMLYLPSKFARKNGLCNKEEMILKNVKNGRSWTVELKSSMNMYCYIGPGWKEFHVENGLKEGDLFKLELVDNGEKPIANFYFQNIS